MPLVISGSLCSLHFMKGSSDGKLCPEVDTSVEVVPIKGSRVCPPRDPRWIALSCIEHISHPQFRQIASFIHLETTILLTYHISHITYHISHITYHISHITYHISHIYI
ncbi:hypothetical protein Pelo_19289 [Pelomyxa schiedti]|nr:hypothetical protein Pelo_19289 [Pelomyxa schiedti]